MRLRERLRRWLQAQRGKSAETKAIHERVRAARRRDIEKLKGRDDPAPEHPGPLSGAGL